MKLARTTKDKIRNTVSDSPRSGRPQKLSYRDVNNYKLVRVNFRLSNVNLVELFNEKLLVVSAYALIQCEKSIQHVENHFCQSQIGLIDVSGVKINCIGL